MPNISVTLPSGTIISGSFSETVDDEVSTWPVYFLRTDAGRSCGRRAKQRNDCTVRALALASDLSYDQAYDLLAKAGRRCGYSFDFKEWAVTATVKGYHFFWRSFPAEKGKSRMNPAKFCNEFRQGRWICRTAYHVFAVVNGVVMDEHSPRPDRCIYGAWEICS